MNKSDSDDQKKVASFSRRIDSWQTVGWWLKKVASFFPGKIGSAAPGEGRTNFFVNRALLRLNPAVHTTQLNTCVKCLKTADWIIPPGESATPSRAETDRLRRLVSASTATCRSCSSQQQTKQHKLLLLCAIYSLFSTRIQH